MSSLPCMAAAPIAFTWFKAPSIGFWSLPQCVQRLWEFLKDIRHRVATIFRLKDWELAEKLGIGRSCVQKALRWAERLGLIERYRRYGRDHGRVIEIVMNLAVPKPREAPAGKSGKAKTRAKGDGQIPNVGHIDDATPQQQAAALAAISAAADLETGLEQAVPTEEEEAQQQSFWAELRAKAAELGVSSGRYKRVGSGGFGAWAKGKSEAEVQAELERRRAAARAKAGSNPADPGLPPAPSAP